MCSVLITSTSKESLFVIVILFGVGEIFHFGEVGMVASHHRFLLVGLVFTYLTLVLTPVEVFSFLNFICNL